jgi:hypothetical protein
MIYFLIYSILSCGLFIYLVSKSFSYFDFTHPKPRIILLFIIGGPIVWMFILIITLYTIYYNLYKKLNDK